MRNGRTVTILVIIITIFGLGAAAAGIFSAGGPGEYEYISIRGETVTIYGKGIYQHMSAEVAPQGIAQDFVTLFIGIPMLLLSLYFARKGSIKGRILLAGTLGYFLVTYLFYLVMAMYNYLYLVYVLLLSASFFGFMLTLMSFNVENLKHYFDNKLPVKLIGGFLIFNSLCIALLWLQVVVPPLLTGSMPVQVEHYTTLIVQGLDLALLLPLAFIAGVLIIRKAPMGYLMASVYLVFLSILMTALVAKIIAMKLLGLNVFPVIIIIPLINLFTVFCLTICLKNINENIVKERSPFQISLN
ncbi:hypothetical protein [Desulfitibacter alkalitolerans]|uniref:hypothetical protein n=1 Tax=Desulfitibacter alkalitolerans TaxID=264641 RepID=UPI0004802ED4|nr:hypothetical protein [Desulfitibacter alkalitolerans]